MNAYDLILIDADETLFDFQKAQYNALQKAMETHSLVFDDEVYQLYDQINNSYWLRLERGEISKKDLSFLRFTDFFKEQNITIDPVDFSLCYTNFLSQGTFLLPGAEGVCKKLSNYYKLSIATNGISSVQHARIKGSSIHECFQHIIVSEDAGAQKPEARFFEYALNICGVPPKSRVLMVGDNLSADIGGAISFGLHTCWYNPKERALPDSIQPTYEIHSLTDLIDILL